MGYNRDLNTSLRERRGYITGAEREREREPFVVVYTCLYGLEFMYCTRAYVCYMWLPFICKTLCGKSIIYIEYVWLLIVIRDYASNRVYVEEEEKGG